MGCVIHIWYNIYKISNKMQYITNILLINKLSNVYLKVCLFGSHLFRKYLNFILNARLNVYNMKYTSESFIKVCLGVLCVWLKRTNIYTKHIKFFWFYYTYFTRHTSGRVITIMAVNGV